MDNLLGQLLSFPPHPPPVIPLSDQDVDDGQRRVVKVLSETSAKKLTLGLSGAGGGDLLDILDPSINTLPYLYVLVAHINNSQSGKQAAGSQTSPLLPGGRLWEPMLRFMEYFDPIQVRYGGSEFRRLLQAVEAAARRAAVLAVAIHPIRTAILRLDPSGACFTSTHLLLIQLCMETQQYEMAKPVLDREIFSFPANVKPGPYTLTHLLSTRKQPSSNYITASSGFTDKISPKDMLLYFLLGGMIYTILNDWERAIQYYSIVIIAPATNAVSKIQIEAYNKRLLVGLLWRGVRLDMPRTIVGTATKVYRATSKAYDAVAEIFQESIRDEKDPRRLLKELEAGQEIWREDFNHGLIIQVFNAYRRFAILKMGKTYSSIAVTDVAKFTSPNPTDINDTANCLQHLISTNQLNAALLQRGAGPETWILKFEEDGPSASEAEQHRELQHTEARIQDLTARITESDQKMGLSKEYLEWSRKAEAKSKEEARGVLFQDMMEDYVQEEDMMTDV